MAPRTRGRLGGAPRSGREAAAIGLAVLLAIGLLAPGLGVTPLDDPGEGQQAEIAREMWAGGTPLDLRLNGVRYFDKPPALYWIAAAAFSIWGPTEWAARLGPVIGATLAVAGTTCLGARLLGPGWGVAAGAALLSSTFFFVYGRYVRPETLFVAAIQWGFAGLLLAGAARGRRAFAVLGGAALGLASLTKDPLGLAGPLLAVAAARALAGRLRPVTDWLPPPAIAAMLGLGLGWYALTGLREPGYLWYTVVDNHLLNVARARHFPDEDVPLSALEFLAVGAAGALPWTIPAVLAVLSLVRRRAWRDPEEIPWTALGIWAVGVFAVFTASPFKLPHYAVPAYPALALLAVRWWRDRAAAAARGAIVFHAALLGILAIGLGAVAWSGGLAFTEAVLTASDVSARQEGAVREAAAGPVWATLDPLIRRTTVAFGAAAIVLLVLAWRRAPRTALAVVLTAMLAAMTAAATAMDGFAASRSVAGMAREIRARIGPDEILVHEGPIENSGALEFYSGRRPILLEARRSVLGFGGTYPEAAEWFWDGARLRREWLADRRILLLSPREPGASVIVSLPPDRVEVLARGNGRTLYRSAAGRR